MAVSEKQKIDSKQIFYNELGRVLVGQVLFQILFTVLLFSLDLENKIEPIQYVNISAYFFIAFISLCTLKYTIANRPLVILFIIEFFYLALNTLILLVFDSLSNESELYFNIYSNVYIASYIIFAAISILITTYLFFYSLKPKLKGIARHILLAVFISGSIVLVTYSDIVIFVDFINLGSELFSESLNSLMLDTYYVYLINLSFLLFIWFTYNQGHYILSEYLPSIISMHTLMIANDIYQLYNSTNLLQNYIDAQYFNTIVDVGFILIWIIRLNYLTKPENKKNEHFVLNYDLLKGFVEKPHDGFWKAALIKLGKQRFYIASSLLFIIISIPLLFLGDFSYFMRYNILLMLLFLVGVMIYAIVYTQRKWFNHVGFLIQRNKKDQIE